MQINYTWLIILMIVTNVLHAQVITTVAGSTCGAYQGDGGLATSAQLSEMYYCYPAFDNAGNMYFAESGTNVIYRVDAITGIITTVAGTFNVIGYSGDGGPAKNALLYHPSSIAVDDFGNIYFVDQVADVIRKINTSGIISTITGPETTSCIVGDGGPLSGARFRAISALTTDHAGNLYISDYGCDVIRKVNSAGIVTTVAGNGSQGFSGDGGLATSAQLAYPTKVAVDNSGNIYIPDSQNHRVRKVSIATGIITTVAGNGISGYTGDGGLATAAEISFPGAVVIDNAGNFYFGDYNNVIRKVDPSGIITTYAGTGVAGYTGDGGPAQNAEIYLTEGRINMDNNGNIYFVNFYSCVIRKISNCGTPLSANNTPVKAQFCNAGTADFFITATNALSYQWQQNSGSGWIPISDNAVYNGSITNQLAINASNASLNGYLFRCAATNSCGTVFSVPDTLSILANVAPSISISGTNNNICAGGSVTFAANPSNGGSAPQYKWMKNGVQVGTNSDSYSDNALNNSDQISCLLTSNATCLTNTQAVSNKITVNVNPDLQATITIIPSATEICNGALVNFTSSINNAGNSPSFQWLKNGMPVGANSPSYSDSQLQNGDQISCTVTSNYICPVSPNSGSNIVSLIVNPTIDPTVSISAQSAFVCPGSPGLFNAITTNVSSVQYQWIKNGANVGTNSSNYIDSNVNKGDIYSCFITASGTCLSSPTATSNSVQLNLFSSPQVTLDQNPYLCTNGNRLLDAGNFKSYLWNNGTTQRTLLVADTGKFEVTVTDNNGCTGSDSVDISAFVPAPSDFLPADTSICSYGTLTLTAKAGYDQYVWNDNTLGPNLTIKQPGLYYVEVTDQNNCKGTDSIYVSSKQCRTGFYVPTAFTPNHDGKNDDFKPMLYGDIVKYKFDIYNRWGQVIFETSVPGKGWDGSFKGEPQNVDAYVWTCTYQFAGDKQVSEKGTVVLIR